MAKEKNKGDPPDIRAWICSRNKPLLCTGSAYIRTETSKSD
jgi:hypothetical protein